jgi:hypothetical protein
MRAYHLPSMLVSNRIVQIGRRHVLENSRTRSLSLAKSKIIRLGYSKPARLITVYRYLNFTAAFGDVALYDIAWIRHTCLQSGQQTIVGAVGKRL